MHPRRQRLQTRPTAPRRASAAILAVLALGALTGACADELPIAERIASTRPLATRIEILEPTNPPEDATRAEGLPLETLRIVPFVVGTAAPLTATEIATEIEPIWIACNMQPQSGLFGCISERFPIALADIEDCAPTDISALDPAAGLPLPPNPCRIIDGTPGEPQMQIPLDLGFLLGGDLEITMIGHEPGQGGTEACARALLGDEGALPDSCIVSTMRVAVGPDGELTELADMFGLADAFDLGAVPDPIPEPDHNPRITSFSVAVIDPDDNVLLAVDLERGDTIPVNPGDRIEIITEAPEDDLQTYAIPSDETFEDQVEVYEGAWFRTWGTLLSPTSDDPKSTNTWTMTRGEQDEDDLPPGGEATLYYVLRDDRQGVDWFWFTAAVAQP